MLWRIEINGAQFRLSAFKLLGNGYLFYGALIPREPKSQATVDHERLLIVTTDLKAATFFA